MVIAVTGQKGSGKDTASSYLAENYNYKTYALAEPIKFIGNYLFGFSTEKDFNKEEVDPRWGISPRQFWQYFGTELMQWEVQKIPGWKVGRNIWMELFWDTYEHSPSKNFIITDLRMQHEKEFLLKAVDELVVVQIYRKGTGGDFHSSETEVGSLNPDVIISNNGDLEKLYYKLDEFAMEYGI